MVNLFSGLQSFLSKDTLRGVDQLFSMLDANRDGKVSKREIKELAKAQNSIILDSQLNPFFETLDTNRDGGITKHELITFLQSPAQWTSLVFRYVDSNRDGYINQHELKEYMEKNIPETQLPNKKDVKEVFKMLDQNKDGKISWNEVHVIMVKNLGQF